MHYARLRFLNSEVEREKAEQDAVLDAISRKLDGISGKASAIRDEAMRQRNMMTESGLP